MQANFEVVGRIEGFRRCEFIGELTLDIERYFAGDKWVKPTPAADMVRVSVGQDLMRRFRQGQRVQVTGIVSPTVRSSGDPQLSHFMAFKVAATE